MGRSTLLFLSFGVVVAFAQTPQEALPTSSDSVFMPAAVATDTIAVAGRCKHCKERIEGAVRQLPGVQSAEWDRITKLLIVTYDTRQTSRSLIQKRLAAVGHDTEEFTAPDEAYAKLPKCCRYRSP